MKKFKVFWEQFYPHIISGIIFIGVLNFLDKNNIPNPYSFKDVIISVNTFASVVIGFTSIFLGFLYNSTEASGLHIGLQEKPNVVRKIFFAPIICSFLLLILGILFLFNLELNVLVPTFINQISISLWISSIAFLVLSIYRVTLIVSYAIFHEDDTDKYKVKSEISEEKRKQLENKHKKSRF